MFVDFILNTSNTEKIFSLLILSLVAITLYYIQTKYQVNYKKSNNKLIKFFFYDRNDKEKQ